MSSSKVTKLNPSKAGFLLVDAQEKLFREIENPCDVMYHLQKAIKGMNILNIPIYVSEQYPEGLGYTVGVLKSLLSPEQKYLPKTTFSCLDNPQLKEELLNHSIEQWIIAGIEAHVCVLQTAKDLLMAGKEVVVLNDCISSRSIYDFSTAIAEMRDYGIRISSTETVLFELLKDSKSPQFKQVSQLIKDAMLSC